MLNGAGLELPSWNVGDSLRKLRVVFKDRISAERGYLRADVAKARAAVTPARQSAVAVFLGIALIVYSVEQWLPVLAGIVAGLILVVYGFLFVNLDEVPKLPRRRR